MANSRGVDIHKGFEMVNGSPLYLGTIQSTGANVISNLTGAIVPGEMLMVQPDATGYVLPSEASASPKTVNSSTTGVKLAADEKYYLKLADAQTQPGFTSTSGATVGEGWLQWISGAGTTNLKVWRLR